MSDTASNHHHARHHGLLQPLVPRLPYAGDMLATRLHAYKRSARLAVERMTSDLQNIILGGSLMAAVDVTALVYVTTVAANYEPWACLLYAGVWGTALAVSLFSVASAFQAVLILPSLLKDPTNPDVPLQWADGSGTPEHDPTGAKEAVIVRLLTHPFRMMRMCTMFTAGGVPLLAMLTGVSEDTIIGSWGLMLGGYVLVACLLLNFVHNAWTWRRLVGLIPPDAPEGYGLEQ